MSQIPARWLILDPADPNALTAETIATQDGPSIATQLGVASSLVSVSADDQTYGNLADKLVEGNGVTLTINNDGGAETLAISIQSVTESLIPDGGIIARLADNETVTGAWTFSNTLTVDGDLIINGSTVTTNASTVTVDDPIITLGGDTAPTTNDAKDRGIEFRYHNGTASKLGFYGYDNSTGKFSFLKDASNSGEVFSGTKAEVDAHIDWSNLLNVPNLTGSTSQDFAIKDLSLAGNIIPTTNGLQDIGSATNRFGSIYVNEARLSTNTLYIGDTPILGTSAQTIQIHADPDQSISVMTTGTGTTNIQSVKGVTLATSGINADVFVNATGAGSNVRFGATNEIQFAGAGIALNAPTTMQSGTVSGNFTVTGNLTVNGSQSIINSTIVQVKDNIVVYNAGELGSGVTAGKAGIQIDRGDLSDYQLIFDESDDMFKVGVVGSLETLATQPWVTSGFSASNHNHTLDGLSNVTTSGKQADQVLKWNGTTWVNSTIYLTTTLDSLTDTVITSAATGNILKYDGTNWVNTTLTGAGITPAGIGAVATSTKGEANGVCPLNASALIDAQYLPSFVDDVLEVNDFASLPTTGETGKIYVTKDANLTYRWSGSAYIEINSAVSSADTATRLATARSISVTGDATWTTSFDGTANVTAALTLANSGVTAGSYNSVTVDSKGRVTAGTSDATLAHGNITSATLAATLTTANQVIASLESASFRSAKITVQATAGSNYQATELLVIHDGTNATLVEYGTVATNGTLATFDADISSGNLRLLTTPNGASTTFKAVITAINV